MKPTNGEGLYAIFTEKMNDQGIEIDEWEDLDESDRQAWNELAGEIWT